jgi:glycosyltransferase involved in cell wall biosynthesis
MRIGIITGEYPPMQGGVGAYTSILAAELARQGQAISILSSKAARNSNPEIALSNCIEQWSFGSLNQIRDWAAEQRLDMVNIQFQTAAFGMSPWIHLLPDVLRSVPVVTTFHDLRFPYLFPKAGKLRQWMVMHLAKASDGVILTNHEDYAQISAAYQKALIPIGSNMLKPLPNDFDPAHWRAQAGAQPDDFVMAYFGLINRSKGLETLLESLGSLREAGIPARLVMVGGGIGTSDPTNKIFTEEIQRLTDKLDLREHIHFTAYLDEDATVGAYLAASDVVALPFLDGASYRRGSLMAAIHYGRAIVTTMPTVEIPLFRDHENMLLVPPSDSEALTSSLRNLYQSTELRNRLREGARALSQEFDWSQIANAYSRFFQQVTA